MPLFFVSIMTIIYTYPMGLVIGLNLHLNRLIGLIVFFVRRRRANFQATTLGRPEQRLTQLYRPISSMCYGRGIPFFV